jgi:hypothetical protein
VTVRVVQAVAAITSATRLAKLIEAGKGDVPLVGCSTGSSRTDWIVVCRRPAVDVVLNA